MLNAGARVRGGEGCSNRGSLVRGVSLSGNGLVLGESDVLADAAEGSDRVVELLGSVDAFAHGQRSGVVEHLHLVLAGLAFVDSAHTRVLLVQPRALHVSLLLRVVSLRVDLADQVGDLLDALLLARPQVPASLSLRGLLECRGGLCWALLRTLSKVVSGLSAEGTCGVAGVVSVNDGAKAGLGSVDGPVNEVELANVVLIDHAQDGLFFARVHSWFLNFLLRRRLQLSLLTWTRSESGRMNLRSHRRG